jgi:hypothetical protein
MKRLVIAVLWGAFLAYALVLLPEGILGPLEKEIGSVWTIIAKAAGGSALGPLLAFVFFSSDSAFNGSGKTAKWTRSRLPSVMCAEKTGYTANEAQTLWFRYFDTWALPGSPNQAILQNTYSATYSARLVYHLSWACAILFVLSLVTLSINQWVLGRYQTLKDAWPHLLVTGLYGVGWLWLSLNNQIGGQGREPTGAWKRLDEVFGRSFVLLQYEVLDGTNSVTEAMAKVEELRKQVSSAGTGN